jgi:SOS-response transcriptional repressor LexA
MAHHPRLTGRVLGYRAVQVLEYVRRYAGEHGHSPDYLAICNGVGISSKGEVSRIIASLERRGLLSRVGSGRVRRIRLRPGAHAETGGAGACPASLLTGPRTV